MAIILNDNIKINAGKPSESKYLNSSNVAYSATTEANTAISISERHLGLTVLVDTGTSNVEYWWREGVDDVDLIQKNISGSEIAGDFVSGATNLGYFTGTTGVQRLAFNGFPTSPITFDGFYYSEYQWYYADSGGIIRIGSPSHNGPLRRAYVKADRSASWIWDVSTAAWILSNNDVVANVGMSTNPYTYAGTGYTEITWITGFQSNGSTSITGSGGINTGTTEVTTGNPIYSYKEDSELHFFTPISDTPEFLKITNDDYYLRFSGVSSVISGQNIGTGADVFAQKTGTTLQFRKLRSSGDTTVTQVGDEIRIYSTGGTGSINIDNLSGGTGEIYKDTSGTTINLRTLKGSGSTVITTSGDTVIIDSSGGGGVFDDDITVSLNDGKTFGKYEDGDTIPASGKTAGEVIIMATFEAIDPTPVLSSSGNNVAFGESGKTVNLNFSYTINTPGASVVSASLQFYSGSTWVELTGTTTTPDSYTHNIDDSANRFITGTLQYRYIVVDDAGASGTTTHSVSRQTYAAPSMSLILNGTVPSPETQTVREKGNVTGGISSGSIISNRSLVNITDWTLERRYDGGTYTVLDSGTGLSDLSISVPTTADNAVPTTATSIEYRLTYTDEYTSGAGGSQSISFRYFSFWGYNTNIVLLESEIEALANSAFKTTQALTWTVTAAISEYTYYAYPSSFSDLTSIIRDGIVEDITAWGKLADVNVTNSYGEGLLYTVYRTNAPGAYSGNSLVFS